MTRIQVGKIWQSVPWNTLPKSARVDLAQFLANKPAIRTKVKNLSCVHKVVTWAKKCGLVCFSDHEGYVVIAKNSQLAREVLKIDQSSTPHEWELGLLLGYPKCCCNYIAAIGEENIDTISVNMKNWNFIGKFRLINPHFYLQGRSLISHLPCSPKCLPSLVLAHRTLLFMKKYSIEQA